MCSYHALHWWTCCSSVGRPESSIVERSERKRVKAIQIMKCMIGERLVIFRPALVFNRDWGRMSLALD